MPWIRVSRQNRCSQCGHDSWCVYNESVAICMRVKSERPFTSKSGETGWIHQLASKPKFTRYQSKPAPTINCRNLITEWTAQTRSEWLGVFAKQLGMTDSALKPLNCCWSTRYSAWAFPMSSGYGNWVGIRLRTPSGNKFAVPGSHQGIFVPNGEPHGMVLLTEGPTDCAAAIHLGYYAYGRPSCSGGVAELKAVLSRNRVSRVAIIADNDQAGVSGAAMLKRHLQCSSCIIVLPSKDLRSFVNLGGTKELLDSMIGSAVWARNE